MRTRRAPRLRRRPGRARAHIFPSGAKVYVDGQYTAKVLQAFPQGSTSYLFPHYQVQIGNETSVVAMNRVGVVKKKRAAGLTPEEERWAAEYDAKHPLGTLEEARKVAGHARFIGPRLMTLADAKEQLRPIGVVLTKRDGEYRVNRKGAGEGAAYYTDDLWDAVATGQAMKAH
jgi:hypothetical protein